MIVPAAIQHLNEIVQIEKDVFPQPWSLKQFDYDLNIAPNSENWVYLNNEQVQGYIFGWIVKDEFHLNNIAVHPDYQRRSIGKKLIQHIITRVASQNVTSIFLEVSAGNTPARNCYQSFGFIEGGVRKDYYGRGDDAVLYQLELNSNG